MSEIYGTRMHELLERFAGNKLAPTFRAGTKIRWNGKFGTVAMRWAEPTKWAVQMEGHPRGSYTLLFESQMEVIA